MRIKDALALIEAHETRVRYRVSFERREGGMLCSDYFPAQDEIPIDSEFGAWNLAERFAATDPNGLRFVNIYVVNARTYKPVEGGEYGRAFNRH